ncbi:MAG: hypothetical protein Q7R41_04520 [Phycisphaerales bacterium]|nr:hypothetical protein [Phycisphaerales bacterium]
MDRTTVGSLLRSTQALCLQLCQKQTLDYGIAHFSERFAALPDANQFREVLIDDPARIPDAFAQADAWFTERKLVCHRWSPAGGQSDDALAMFLASRGYRPRPLTAMILVGWRELAPAPDVRVVPARALREMLRRSYLDDDTPPTAKARELLAESYNERMDDPQLDLFVATIDRRPAGRVALYQVGDIARIVDLTVLPAFVDRGVEYALLGHALALAKRLALPSILAQVAENATTHRRWLTDAGFVEDGRIVEFERSTPFETVAPQ